MKNIFDQINNNDVLIYPENVTAVIKQIETASFTNDQALDAYFPEDTYEVIPESHFDKVEIGDGNFIYHGDNMDVLRSLPDNSIDGCITDGPYGLTFFQRKWDADVPSVELWKEVNRVLKPGGMVLSFGSCKTYHRMAVNVEEAGFEIRDMAMWIYSSGFPKSKNVGLQIDKKFGHPNRGHRVATASRTHPDGTIEPNGKKMPPYITKSKEAKPFEGYGTNLKPAHEPILMARKPYKGSIASNVLKWNTGGLNIKGSWINNGIDPEGRFPANILLDETAGGFLDEQANITAELNSKGKNNNRSKIELNPSRLFFCSKASKKERDEGLTNDHINIENEVIQGADNDSKQKSKRQIINTHPTVKPVDLMQQLINTVMPPSTFNNVILDPFMGSGSTLLGIIKEGNNNNKFIGIEKEKEYFDIAVKRCRHEFDKCNKTAA
jgi:DNA modification methylase